eukprot:scaffold241_cov340-Pavlova_lutheri.AAC.36
MGNTQATGDTAWPTMDAHRCPDNKTAARVLVAIRRPLTNVRGWRGMDHPSPQNFLAGEDGKTPP